LGYNLWAQPIIRVIRIIFDKLTYLGLSSF
jgi:hypothetical protein